MKSFVALVLLSSVLHLNRKSVDARAYWQPLRDRFSSHSMHGSWNGGGSSEVAGGDSGDVGDYDSGERFVQSYGHPGRDWVIGN